MPAEPKAGKKDCLIAETALSPGKRSARHAGDGRVARKGSVLLGQKMEGFMLWSEKRGRMYVMDGKREGLQILLVFFAQLVLSGSAAGSEISAGGRAKWLGIGDCPSLTEHPCW